MVLLRRFRGRLGPIALAVAGVTAASAVWMAVLYQPGQDPSRLYYGTDTRISTILMGALLALFWRPSALAHGGARRHGPLFDVIGVAALAGVLLFFLHSTDTAGSLYRGGFVGLAALSALAVAAATHPGTYFGKALGVGALTWIGRALLRALPLALADLRADPAGPRRAPERLAAARRCASA